MLCYSQDSLTFRAPAGQCDAPMNLTLVVAGQPSVPLLFAFDEPEIAELSLDGVPLGSDCQRASLAGCGLGTSGGYTVTITGANFGLDDRAVLFGGEAVDADSVAFEDHERATFVVPAGVGAHVPVVVRVGGRESAPFFFAYDPPFVTSITPNQFDAAGDLLEIYGRNFGTTLEDAGDIVVTVGNDTCGPVRIGSQTAAVWQVSREGTPYLWCSVTEATVGTKDVAILIAGQNYTRGREVSGVRGACAAGFYGQQAWTVFSFQDGATGDVGCKMPCDASAVNARSPDGRGCTAHYDGEAGGFALVADGPQPGSPECSDDWTCMVNAELSGGGRANCTVLTRRDEHCVRCPAGSNCSESSTLYSVEPVAQPGFWRSAIPDGEDGFACDPGRRHRPYCWDFAPCAPENACAGDNLCQKGYTEDKCAQCCDFNFKDNPNCAGTLDKNGDVQIYHRVYGNCEKCPDNIYLLLIMAACALVVAVLVGWRMHKKRVDLGIFSIGVDYF